MGTHNWPRNSCIVSTYYKPMMYYKPTPSSARSSCIGDVMEIAHGFILRTTYYTVLGYDIPSSVKILPLSCLWKQKACFPWTRSQTAPLHSSIRHWQSCTSSESEPAKDHSENIIEQWMVGWVTQPPTIPREPTTWLELVLHACSSSLPPVSP